MRIWWVAVVLALWTLRADAAGELWSFTPPASWKDVTAEAEKEPAVSEHVKRLAAAGTASVMKFWADDAGNALQLIYILGPGGTIQGMEGFEKGAREAAQKLGTPVSYDARRVGHTLVADQVVAVDGARISARRICGAHTRDKMVAVQATCRGTDEICKPILDTLALDAARLVEPGQDRSASYRTGKMLGTALLGALIAAWLVSAYHRRRAKKLA